MKGGYLTLEEGTYRCCPKSGRANVAYTMFCLARAYAGAFLLVQPCHKTVLVQCRYCCLALLNARIVELLLLLLLWHTAVHLFVVRSIYRCYNITIEYGYSESNTPN